MRKLLAQFFLIGFLFSFAPFFVFASKDELRLVPAHPDPRNPKTFSFLLLSGRAGEEKKGEFAAVNLTEKEKKLQFFFVGAKVDEKGEIIASSKEETPIKEWLTLFQSEVSLSPKERKNFPFLLKIPFSAQGGEYVGAILAESAFLPVIVSVEGERNYQLEVGEPKLEFSDDRILFKITVKNKGNSLLSFLSFKIVLTNRFSFGLGKSLTSFWGEEEVILPQKEKEFLLPFESPLPFFGFYQAEISVKAGSEEIKKNFSFNFFNWKKGAIFAFRGIIFLMFMSFLFFLRGLVLKKLKEKRLEENLNTNLAISSFFGKEEKKQERVEKRMREGEIFPGEENLALLKAEDYEKLWFKVRKIVREEIELAREMEKFRREVKRELKKELLKKEKRKNFRV